MKLRTSKKWPLAKRLFVCAFGNQLQKNVGQGDRCDRPLAAAVGGQRGAIDVDELWKTASLAKNLKMDHILRTGEQQGSALFYRLSKRL